ncbi:MAG: hypothetical protein HY286_16800 [Planctomycetes bacterium]|nr:hypothetical protein [Planctomycetota bacterium]
MKLPADPIAVRPSIRLRGARDYPLRALDVDFRIGRKIVICGVSGSGKSALAFHTIAREGLRQLLESTMATRPQFAIANARRLAALARPQFRQLDGLPAVIAVGQGDLVAGPHSTLGEIAGISAALRVLLARFGTVHCPKCKIPRPSISPRDVAANLLTTYPDESIRIMARIRATGPAAGILESLPKRGILRAWLVYKNQPAAEIRLDDPFNISEDPSEIYAVVDRLAARHANATRIFEAIDRAVEIGLGIVSIERGNIISHLATARACPNCNIELAAPAARSLWTSAPPGRCETCAGRGADSASGAACAPCAGSGYSDAARSLLLENCSIADFVALDAHALLRRLESSGCFETAAARELYNELRDRAEALRALGLGSMPLSRKTATLSTGESRRARCAAAFGARVRGALFILDEPTVGLHAADRALLLLKINEIAARGNTMLTVEHDTDTMRAADELIELGPGAGARGGTIIFQGGPAEIAAPQIDTPTARAMRGELDIPVSTAEPAREFIQIRGARGHNLKNVDARFPIGRLTAVTGVSGSGKSSLIFGTLAAAARRALRGHETASDSMLPHDGVAGLELFERRLVVGPRLPGRAARSTPASYLGVAAELRELLASTPAARARGLDASNFSANRAGWRKRDGEDLLHVGRCEACAGLGFRELDLELLESVSVTCEVCRGSRFSATALEVRWKGRSVADWNTLTIEEAAAELAAIPAIARALGPALELGIGYLRLGERGDVLSGGEWKRLQIAKELGRANGPGRALVLLDEPTRGLHAVETGRLMRALRSICSQGGTVIVVEHSLSVARAADWIVEIGPGAGADGGIVLFEGAPAEFIKNSQAPTARAMRGEINTIPSGAAAAPPPPEHVIIEGARAKNLKNLSLQIRRGALTCIAGPRGAGKTALACDVLGSEARRRFMLALAPAARRAADRAESADVDRVDGTGIALVFDRDPSSMPWGESAGILPLLRSLFVSYSQAHCPGCGDVLRRREPQEARDLAFDKFKNQKCRIVTSLSFVDGEKWSDRQAQLRARGFARVLVNGAELRIEEAHIVAGDAVELVVDRIALDDASRERCLEALEEAAIAGRGRGAVETLAGERVEFDRLGGCAKCKLTMERPLAHADFQQKKPGPWAAAARVAGTAWPAAGFDLILTKNLMLQLRRAPVAAAGPILAALERRVAAVDGLARETLPLDAGAFGARERASWIAAGMTVAPGGSLLILDDPTRGLDAARAECLLQQIRTAVASGATAVVASADPLAARFADDIVRLGPGAGADGGNIVTSAPPPRATITKPRGEFYYLESYPEDVDRAGLRAPFESRRDILEIGFDEPPEATPAELLQILPKIAALYARAPEARELALDAGRFDYSRETGGGRCGLCRGRGAVELDFDFLPGDTATCPACAGSRYEPRVLSVRLYGRTIAEMLQCSIRDAAAILHDHPPIADACRRADALGLGHCILSQPPEYLNPSARTCLQLANALARDPERIALLLARAGDGIFTSDLFPLLDSLFEFVKNGAAVVWIHPRRDIAADIPHFSSIQQKPDAATPGRRRARSTE